MNERINQLANIWANRRSEDEKLGITYTFSEKALETFTELIVQEMCEVMTAQSNGFALCSNYGAVQGIDVGVRKVKRHFGVEE